MFSGGKRAEQIEQVIRMQYRLHRVAVAEERVRGRIEIGRVQRARTAHSQVDPGVKRRKEELGPGEAQVVSGEGESVVLPKAVADELRADVQEDASV